MSRAGRGAAVVAGALIALAACTRDSPIGDGTTTPSASIPAAPVVTDGPSPPIPVGPPDGHPLHPLDRDAGVSARLRDGSMIWFFGDTGQFDGAGRLVSFEIGTAAWAPAATPTATADFDDGFGRPVAFATPTPSFPTCPPEAPSAGMWPLSAIVVPDGEVDRVVVWMLNICLGSATYGATMGTSVGEWVYDPHAPRDGAIEVTVLNQLLFEASPGGRAAFGTAAVLTDGLAYVYTCGIPERAISLDDYGPCHVARVEPSKVADPDAYEMWTGVTWEPNGDPAPLLLDEHGGQQTPPVGPFSVGWDESSEQFVMVYSPWPAYSPNVEIRVANRPEGPWSAPAFIELPGCADRVGPEMRTCYGANVQPSFNAAGRLGIGYQDQLVADSPRRGSFLLTTVGVDLTAG
ncbi:MAG TPA: DUF4185 domain-containing protein [Microthrixaceae bacterium]|nr:DUF4185 domain-containing protein [Microthrixaceae bacterium]